MAVFPKETLFERLGIDMIDVIRRYFSSLFKKEMSFVKIELDFETIFRSIFLVSRF
jgi:hypothetical protein